MLLTLDWLWERPQTLIQRRHVSSVRVGLANCTKRTPSRNSFSSSSSSPNNIQDQCLIITDIYGVREKGVWLKNQKILCLNWGNQSSMYPTNSAWPCVFFVLFFVWCFLTPSSSRAHFTPPPPPKKKTCLLCATTAGTYKVMSPGFPKKHQSHHLQLPNPQEWQRWRLVM